MKYTRGQFTNEYYQLWEIGLVVPVPMNAFVFSVKYRKNNLDEYSRITLKAVSVSDALERTCYAVSFASPWRPEDIDLHAVYDSEDNLLWIDEPFYDIVQKKNEFRGMERREFMTKFGMTAAAILFGFRPMQALGGSTVVTFGGTASGFPAPPGEQLYTTPGSYNWTVPSGVTSVCVVCVGGGGGNQGGGGGLGYKNNISVTPGQAVAVTVGGGSTATGGTSSYGGILSATGGTGGPSSVGGQPSGHDGGGNGGGNTYSSVSHGGGGGAGGYSGDGGFGGVNYTNGTAGAGGGGGGGYGYAGPGGGVGLYGIGSNGTAGTGSGAESSYRVGVGGGGGSSGSPGVNGSSGYAGIYGGGGSGMWNTTGASGAVRIIWGVGRNFPSHAT